MTDTMLDRMRILEDRLAIMELVGGYALNVDARNYDALAGAFVEDARFYTEDNSLDARGSHVIKAMMEAELPKVAFQFHTIHQHVISFDATDSDRASGIAAGHAEIMREGQAMVLAMRYHDQYQRRATGWKFVERRLEYLYYTPPEGYAKALAASPVA